LKCKVAKSIHKKKQTKLESEIAEVEKEKEEHKQELEKRKQEHEQELEKRKQEHEQELKMRDEMWDKERGTFQEKLQKEKELLKQDHESHVKKVTKLRRFTNGDTVVKYFSRNRPLYDAASVKETFGIWKREYLENIWKNKEEKMKGALKQELEFHLKARGNLVLKYFAEKHNLKIHDDAMKREMWNMWRE
jgi:hypothetical protein